MTYGLYNNRLSMLLDFFNHGVTFSMITCINPNFNQFMRIEGIINFQQHIFCKASITDNDNNLAVMGEFTKLLNLIIG